jgi:hypothetical protein
MTAPITNDQSAIEDAYREQLSNLFANLFNNMVIVELGTGQRNDPVGEFTTGLDILRRARETALKLIDGD